MEWLGYVLSFIQNNKLLYLFCVAIFLGVVSLILNEGQHKADKNKEKTEKQPWKNQASAKRKHMIITFCLCFLAALIPLAVSMYYPFVEPSDVAAEEPDGYIKLSFYDGKFAYRNYVGQEVYDENDVNSPWDRSYFEDPIAPLVYITITDASNQVIYDGRSEHMESCLIGLNYGTYTLIASCDNYQKYTTTVELTPEEKDSNIWQHKIFFVPDTAIATDIRIQVVDQEGIPYSNIAVGIGYPGYSLIEEVDENGMFDELFVLAKGEYLVYIEERNLSGRVVINELTDDGAVVVVTLD